MPIISAAKPTEKLKNSGLKAMSCHQAEEARDAERRRHQKDRPFNRME